MFTGIFQIKEINFIFLSSLYKLQVNQRHAMTWSTPGSHGIFLQAWCALSCVLLLCCRGSCLQPSVVGCSPTRGHAQPAPAAPDGEKPALGSPANQAFWWPEEGSLGVRFASYRGTLARHPRLALPKGRMRTCSGEGGRACVSQAVDELCAYERGVTPCQPAAFGPTAKPPCLAFINLWSTI